MGLVYFGSNDNNLYAVNTSTGAKIWSFQTGDDILSSPSIANNIVYVGSNDFHLYALNAQTGTLLWSYRTLQGVESTPTIVNGVLYVGSMDGNIYAFGSITVSQSTSPLSSAVYTSSSSPSASVPQETPLTVVLMFVLVSAILIVAVGLLVYTRNRKRTI